MKKWFSFTLIFILCLYLLGCKNVESRDNEMNEIDIYDFAHINKAPESEEKHALNQVIKVYFSENDSSLTNRIAIDIEHKKIYENPRMSARGLRLRDGTTHVENIEKVLEILDKYNVQDWENNYIFSDPDTYEDGYAWRLWLQYEDGTVEKHEGNEEDLLPENFGAFVEELTEFVEEQLNDSDE